MLLIGLMAGLLVGTVRISSLLAGDLPARIGETVRAEVVVTGPVSANSGWQSATADVVRVSPDENGQALGAGEAVLLEVAPPKEAGDAAPASAAAGVLTQGARLSVSGTLAAPQGPSASGFDQATRLLHQGIRVVLEVDSASGMSYLGRRGGVSGAFDRLREGAQAHLSLGPDARVNEVLQGVVMGDTTGIDEGWMEAFRRSGTAHMLSVSGLHVACLAAIMIAIAGFARLSRRTGFVLAAGAALLMVPFVGPSAPIIRSAAMMMVVLAGRLVGRRRDQWQGLAMAALVVLAINPFAVFDVGFQLSFSAFAGMLGLVGPLERVFHRLPESARANLAVSVAATLGTAPVSMAGVRADLAHLAGGEPAGRPHPGRRHRTGAGLRDHGVRLERLQHGPRHACVAAHDVERPRVHALRARAGAGGEVRRHGADGGPCGGAGSSRPGSRYAAIRRSRTGGSACRASSV